MRTVQSKTILSTFITVSSVLAQTFPQQGIQPQMQQPASQPQQLPPASFQPQIPQPAGQPQQIQPVAQPSVPGRQPIAPNGNTPNPNNPPINTAANRLENAATPKNAATPSTNADGLGGTSGKNPMSAPDGIASPCASKCLDDMDVNTYCTEQGSADLSKCLGDNRCPDIKLVTDQVNLQCTRSRLGANSVGLGGSLKSAKDGQKGQDGSTRSKSSSIATVGPGRFLANMILAFISVFVLL